MKYTISPEPSHQRSIEIRFSFLQTSEKSLLCLPAWRPGRYELGNFARNIRSWSVQDDDGQEVRSLKISKDQWEIDAQAGTTLHVSFSYYAAELNAGSTWTDDEQIYVNPVNCLPYLDGFTDRECEVELVIPDNWKIACSLPVMGGRTLRAKDYHELADSPFIAGSNLVHNYFVYEGIIFHLWFCGMERPDWSKLLNDFFLFTHEQYELFKSFPVKEYHYLFQITPYKLHHGVEHQASTVIALGPGNGLMKGAGYNELLAICSHELFHTWNVKAIRPAEMYPYRYNQENYSRLGFVYEGVTTYYGDLILYKARVFSTDEFMQAFRKQFQRHFDNPGRFNMPVSEASFDTWLDGYIPGIPNRKTNIYTEGALVAFMSDILIRYYSSDKHSLDDVLRALNEEFGKKGRGYTEDDYRALITRFAGRELEIFDDLIYGKKDYSPRLSECLGHIGLKMERESAGSKTEILAGMRMNPLKGNVVMNVLPDSPADLAGLAPGDEIIAIDGIRIEGLPDDFLHEDETRIAFFRDHRLREASLTPSAGKGYFRISIKPEPEATEEQRLRYSLWSKNPFPA